MSKNASSSSSSAKSGLSRLRSLLNFINRPRSRAPSLEAPPAAEEKNSGQDRRTSEPNIGAGSRARDSRGLSSTWSYSMTDPFEELGNPAEMERELSEDEVFLDDYIEDEYWLDYSSTDECVSEKNCSQVAPKVKMGISSLERTSNVEQRRRSRSKTGILDLNQKTKDLGPKPMDNPMTNRNEGGLSEVCSRCTEDSTKCTSVQDECCSVLRSYNRKQWTYQGESDDLDFIVRRDACSSGSVSPMGVLVPDSISDTNNNDVNCPNFESTSKHLRAAPTTVTIKVDVHCTSTEEQHIGTEPNLDMEAVEERTSLDVVDLQVANEMQPSSGKTNKSPDSEDGIKPKGHFDAQETSNTAHVGNVCEKTMGKSYLQRTGSSSDGDSPVLKKDKDSSLSDFSQLVLSSPGFPTSPQTHLYRPISSRRESGYFSRNNTPSPKGELRFTYPRPASPLEYTHNVEELSKRGGEQAVYQVRETEPEVAPVNISKIGLASPSTLDQFDGINALSAPRCRLTKTSNSAQSKKDLKQLKETCELSVNYKNTEEPMVSGSTSDTTSTISSAVEVPSDLHACPIAKRIFPVLATKSKQNVPKERCTALSTVSANRGPKEEPEMPLDFSKSRTPNKPFRQDRESTVDTSVMSCASPVSKMKVPTPISSSSPLHKSSRAGLYPSAVAGDANIAQVPEVSPVRPRRPGLEKKRRRKPDSQTRAGKERSSKGSNESGSGRKGDVKRAKCDKENVKPAENQTRFAPRSTHPFSHNYLLLKRTADFIILRIPSYNQLWEDFDIPKLMEYLNAYFQSEIKRLADSRVQSIWDLRNHKEQQAAADRDLCVRDSVRVLLSACLLADLLMARTCADFMLQRLSEVCSDCPDFMSASPEVVLMVLCNEETTVQNPQGFPLPYRESEIEVLKAASKYVLTNKTDNSEAKRRIRRLLQSATDTSVLDTVEEPPRSFMQRVLLGPPEPPPRQVPNGAENRPPAYRRLAFRPYHETRYERSKLCITAKNTRQEYLLQPFLSSNRRNRADAAVSCLPDDVVPANVEVMEVCNTTHTLKKLTFYYRTHNGVPYITRIEMQYSRKKGRRKRCVLGGPLPEASVTGCSTDGGSADTSDSGVYSRSTSISSSSSLIGQDDSSGLLHGQDAALGAARSREDSNGRGGEKKSRPVFLRRGEHVIGVAVQGDAVLQNIEIRTNLGRRICAHNLPCPATYAQWSNVSLPLGGSPYCLQAFRADVRRPEPNRTYIRNLAAVWAVTSRPLNNLNV
ncbi:uncharacterized protein LOC101852948 [Aplysia californica]|uniref:Uncharacterized protein LOC101852948 n=1 Tax=Aplysia californica TaxID=6500 RepID=A0ABM0JZA1_APLCA|nr:uncharacterized protein LOC101852948 [Aplysia californica]